MSNSLRMWAGWAVGMGLLLGLCVWGLVNWNLNNYSQLVADRLLLLAELRREAVQDYFSTARAELRFWSTTPEMLEAQKALIELWDSDGIAQQVLDSYVEDNPNPPGYYLNLDYAEDGSEYSDFHRQMHARARLFVTRRGFYDFFLIGPEGDVYYSVEKEADFASNLLTGAFRDSGLAEVFVKAKRFHSTGGIAISDMQAYAPSGGDPAMFMATALNDDTGKFLGVIAFQLPTNKMQGIVDYTSGMGETGETYLVGADKLMRSDSRFLVESTILKKTVDTLTVRRALDGEQGMEFVRDYRGVNVMSVYLPMAVGDANWAVMAEIDRAEIELGAARERPALSGALLLVYGMSLWSVWFWRNRQMPGDEGYIEAIDFPDVGDTSGLDG